MRDRISFYKQTSVNTGSAGKVFGNRPTDPGHSSSPTVAHGNMPFDSMPLNLAGFRLVTTIAGCPSLRLVHKTSLCWKRCAAAFLHPDTLGIPAGDPATGCFSHALIAPTFSSIFSKSAKLIRSFAAASFFSTAFASFFASLAFLSAPVSALLRFFAIIS